MHSIREDLEAVTCPSGLTDYVPVMGVTHELLGSELNPGFFSFVLDQLGPHWSPISCVLPRSR